MAEEVSPWLAESLSGDDPDNAIRQNVLTPMAPPEQAAADISLAGRVGQKPEVVSIYRDLMQGADRQSEIDDHIAKAPGLRTFLADPDNYAVSHDDLPQLSWWAGMAAAPQNVADALARAGKGFDEGAKAWTTRAKDAGRREGFVGQWRESTLGVFDPLISAASAATGIKSLDVPGAVGGAGARARDGLARDYQIGEEHIELAMLMQKANPFVAAREGRNATLTPEEEKRVSELRAQVKDKGAEIWGLSDAAQNLPMIFGALGRWAEVAVEDTQSVWTDITGERFDLNEKQRLNASRDSSAPQPFDPNKPIGADEALFKVGFAGPMAIASGATSVRAGSGMMAFTKDIESGLSYDEFSQMRAPDGRTALEILGPMVIGEYADKVGTINALIERAGLAVAMKAIGVEDIPAALSKMAAKRQISEVLKKKLLTEAAAKLTGRSLVVGFEEGATEGTQELPAIAIGDEIAEGIGSEKLAFGEKVARVLEATDHGFQAGVVLGGIGSSPHFAADLQMINESQRVTQMMDEMGKQSSASKLRERLPDKYAQAVEIVRASQGGPLQQMPIDAEKFAEHFESQGIDPYAVAAEVGVGRDQLDQALAAGGTVDIPIGQYAAKIAPTPHHEAMWNNARILKKEVDGKAEFFTPAEINRVPDVQSAWMKLNEQIRREVDDHTARAESEGKVYDAVLAEFQKSGAAIPEVARMNAKMAAAFWTPLAKKMGKDGVKVDPWTAYSDRGLDVRTALVNPEGDASAPDALEQGGRFVALTPEERVKKYKSEIRDWMLDRAEGKTPNEIADYWSEQGAIDLDDQIIAQTFNRERTAVQKRLDAGETKEAIAAEYDVSEDVIDKLMQDLPKGKKPVLREAIERLDAQGLGLSPAEFVDRLRGIDGLENTTQESVRAVRSRIRKQQLAPLARAVRRNEQSLNQSADSGGDLDMFFIKPAFAGRAVPITINQISKVTGILHYQKRNQEPQTVRYAIARDGTIYIWDGNQAIHNDVAEALKVPLSSLETGEITDPRDMDLISSSIEELAASGNTSEEIAELRSVLNGVDAGDGTARPPTMDEIYNTTIMKRVDLAAKKVKPTLTLKQAADIEVLRGRSYNVGGKTVGFDAAVDALIETYSDIPGGVSYDRQAFFILGYPGAGKSTYVKEISKEFHAASIDADVAKVLVPGYENGAGTQKVHNESSALRNAAQAKMELSGANMIVERVGDNIATMERTITELNERGYSVYMIHVGVSPDEAVRRSTERYLQTGRSISPSYMEKMVGKVPPVIDALTNYQPLKGYADINAEGPRETATITRQGGESQGLARAIENAIGRTVGELAADGFGGSNDPVRNAARLRELTPDQIADLIFNEPSELNQTTGGYDPYGEQRADLEKRIDDAAEILGQKFPDFRRNRPARNANSRRDAEGDAGKSDRAGRDGAESRTGTSLEDAIAKVTAASSVKLTKNKPNAAGRFGQYQVRLDVPVDPDKSWTDTVYGAFDSYIEFDILRSGRAGVAQNGPRGSVQIKWSTTAIDVRDTGLGKFLYRQFLDWAFSEGRRVFSDHTLSPASQILYGQKFREYGYEVVFVAEDAAYDETGWLRSASQKPLFEVRPTATAQPYAHAPMDGLKIGGPSLRQRLADNAPRALNQAGDVRKASIIIPDFTQGLMRGERALVLMREASDLSSFMHEFGHYALAVYQSLANEENAPQAIVDDFAKIRNWMSTDESVRIITRDANRFHAKRLPGSGRLITANEVRTVLAGSVIADRDIWQASHELFARTFEAYLLEGKSPSLELKQVFQAFKEWLRVIYKTVLSLDANLNAEIRDVLDRMVASEDQIAEVQRIDAQGLMTREQFPGTDNQWNRYQLVAARAKQEAEDDLRIGLMQTYIRAQKHSTARLKAAMRHTVERDVDEAPERRAFEWLAYGRWKGDVPRTGVSGKDLPPAWGPVAPPAGLPPMAIDTGAVVDDYGADALAALPVELKPMDRGRVDGLMGEVKEVRKNLKRKGPRTLLQAIKDLGGIRDDSGDVLGIIGRKQDEPGLINAAGRDLDNIIDPLWEQGYFGPGPGRYRGDFGYDQRVWDALTERWRDADPEYSEVDAPVVEGFTPPSSLDDVGGGYRSMGPRRDAGPLDPLDVTLGEGAPVAYDEGAGFVGGADERARRREMLAAAVRARREQGGDGPTELDQRVGAVTEYRYSAVSRLVDAIAQIAETYKGNLPWGFEEMAAKKTGYAASTVRSEVIALRAGDYGPELQERIRNLGHANHRADGVYAKLAELIANYDGPQDRLINKRLHRDLNAWQRENGLHETSYSAIAVMKSQIKSGRGVVVPFRSDSVALNQTGYAPTGYGVGSITLMAQLDATKRWVERHMPALSEDAPAMRQAFESELALAAQGTRGDVWTPARIDLARQYYQAEQVRRQGMGDIERRAVAAGVRAAELSMLVEINRKVLDGPRGVALDQTAPDPGFPIIAYAGHSGEYVPGKRGEGSFDWFTSDPSNASDYASLYGGTSNVTRVKIGMKNPLVIENIKPGKKGGLFKSPTRSTPLEMHYKWIPISAIPDAALQEALRPIGEENGKRRQMWGDVHVDDIIAAMEKGDYAYDGVHFKRVDYGNEDAAGGYRNVVDVYAVRDPKAVRFAMGDGPVALDQMAGVRALTANEGALREAQDMVGAGASREEVWRKTGWAVGDDGQWRFEIDTGEAKLIVPLVAVRDSSVRLLDEVIDFPGLFEAYPQLRGVMVDMARGNRNGGWWSRNEPGAPVGVIHIRVRSEARARSVLLHEIQHAIQDIEGFATGGDWTDGSTVSAAPVEFRRMVDEYVAAEDNRTKGTPWRELIYGDNDAAFIAQTRQHATASVKWKLYWRLSGEVEARDVELRATLTEKIRSTMPPMTGAQDQVEAPDRIVVMANPGDAFSGDAPVALDQTAQWGSPEFKAWFGESKVVDADGKPLRVYHGSGNIENIEAFDPKLTGQGNDQLGSGFYFSNEPSTASGYATARIQSDIEKLGGEDSPGVVPVYLSIKKPIELKGTDSTINNVSLTKKQALQIIKSAQNLMDVEESPIGNWHDVWGDGGVQEWMIADVAKQYAGPNLISLENDFFRGNAGAFRDAVHKATGYDGVIQRFDSGEVHFVAWFPEQIKSAIGNRGTFDASNPSILDQLAKTIREDDLLPLEVTDNGDGFIVFQADIGASEEAYMHVYKEKATLYIGSSLLPPSHRGQGLGVRFYASVLDWAKRNGYRSVKSDVIVSDDAQRIYRSLEERGYKVRRLVVGENSGGYLSAQGGRGISPVFGVTPQGPTALDQLANRPSIQDLLDAISQNHAGDPVYSQHDEDLIQERNYWQDQADWMDKNGIDINASAATIRTQIQALLDRESQAKIHPDDIAAAISRYARPKADGSPAFSSGSELLKALAAIKPRRQAIEAELNKRMLDEYGDPMKDGSLMTEARAAAHAEMQGRKIEVELEAIERASGSKRVVRGVARDAAKAQLQNMTIRQIKNADWFLAAERRAAQAAVLALETGDWREAAFNKQRQLLNFWLYREAKDAGKKIERSETRWKRLAESPNVRGKIDADYLDKIDALLEGYELRKSYQSHRQGWRNQELIDWVAEMEASGNGDMVAIDPQILAAAQRRQVNSLRLSEFDGLRDTIANLEHLGRLKDKLLAAQEQRSRDAAVESMVERAETEWPNRASIQQSLASKTPFERVKEDASDLFGMLTKAEYMFRYMDGLKDGGPWMRTFLPAVQRAESKRIEMMEDYTAKFNELISVYDKKELGRMLLLKKWVPEINDNLTKAQMLTVALYSGTAYRKDVMMQGFNWNPSQLKAVLDNLDKRDWDYVQSVWDYVGLLWPETVELHRKMTGVTLKKDPAVPVQTVFGTYPGGYFPIVYNSELSDTARKRENKDLLEGKTTLTATFRKAATNIGRTKELKGSGGQAVSLDMISILAKHVDDAVHDITHREVIYDINKLIADPRVLQIVRKVLGGAGVDVMERWAKSLGKQPIPVDGFEKIMSRARRNIASVQMGWNIKTAALQFLSVTQAIPRNGIIPQLRESGISVAKDYPKFLANQFRRMFGAPDTLPARVQFVFDRSDYMKNRIKTSQREINEASRKRVGSEAGGIPDIPADVRDSYFMFIQMLDMGVSVPTWLAAYETALGGRVDNIDQGDETAAIDHADSVIRMTMGASAPKDLSYFMSAPNLKIWTMFMGWASTFYNQVFMEQLPGVIHGKISKARFAANMLFIWFIPAAITELMYGRMENQDGEDDDDKWRRVALEIMIYPLQGIPLIRDATNAFATGYDYAMSPVQSAIEAPIKLAQYIGDDPLAPRVLKAAFMTLGYAIGVPSKALWRAADEIGDVISGEDDLSDPDDSAAELLWQDKR